MNTSFFLSTLVVVAMIATVGALGIGIVGMFTQGPFYARNSNRLMRLRVLFQATALLLVALAIAMR